METRFVFAAESQMFGVWKTQITSEQGQATAYCFVATQCTQYSNLIGDGQWRFETNESSPRQPLFPT